jgi:hypothetical protein
MKLDRNILVLTRVAHPRYRPAIILQGGAIHVRKSFCSTFAKETSLIESGGANAGASIVTLVENCCTLLRVFWTTFSANSSLLKGWNTVGN